MSTPKIQLIGVKKRFGSKVVLDGIDLTVDAQSSLVIIGGSGTGKSVLIKCILGLIEPDSGSIEIDGFRTSMDAVAAFRFGSVRDSYADKKTGDSRNVGVIGVALFNERGTQPSSWPRGDTRNRLNADPFPGRFATPPPN